MKTLLIQEIIRTVVQITLGKRDRLYLEDLSLKLQSNYIASSLQQDSTIDNAYDIDINATIRDLIKFSFTEMGVEVEFCGRGELEKGVIIDIDEERLDLLDIDKEPIKFGQTVVKIGDKFSNLSEEKLCEIEMNKSQNIQNWQSDIDFSTFIKNIIHQELDFSRKL